MTMISNGKNLSTSEQVTILIEQPPQRLLAGEAPQMQRAIELAPEF